MSQYQLGALISLSLSYSQVSHFVLLDLLDKSWALVILSKRVLSVLVTHTSVLHICVLHKLKPNLEKYEYVGSE